MAKKSKHDKLELKIRKLEKSVSDMEAKYSGFKNSEERFVAGVLKEFEPLLRVMADDAVRKLQDRSMEPSDFIQEAFLYMLTWNMDKVRQLSTLQSMWKPFIKRSLRNCFENLRVNRRSLKRDGILVNLDDLLDYDSNDDDAVFVRDVLAKIDFGTTPESIFLCRENVKIIRKKLGIRERMVFNTLLKCPDTLVSLASERGLTRITRKLLSEYLNLPYSAVVKIYKQIQAITEEVLFDVGKI